MGPRDGAAVSDRGGADRRPGGLGPDMTMARPHEGGDPVDDYGNGSAEVASS